MLDFGLGLFIMSIISVTFVNLNFKVQFGLSVRYVWKASFIILDWLFPTLPPILTKYLLNSSAIIL